MIAVLSSISPIVAVIAILSWIGGEKSVLRKPLYLRGGPWKILRWVGIPLVVYGVFFHPMPSGLEAVNYPMLIGSMMMLLGSARSRKRPVHGKPLFRLGDDSASNSRDLNRADKTE